MTASISPEQGFLDSIIHMFRATKAQGDAALAQLADADFNRTPGPETNSIAVIVRHLHGNMLSRWTDFLTTDGEKPWRDRDGEFEERPGDSRAAIMALWEEGWARVFAALEPLAPGDLSREVLIRGQAHTVAEAAHRQIQHYAYHVGQIALLARMWRGKAWTTLSIPKGKSKSYAPEGRGGEPARAK